MTWRLTVQIALLAIVFSFCGVILMLVDQGKDEQVMAILDGATWLTVFLVVVLAVGLFFRKIMSDL